MKTTEALAREAGMKLCPPIPLWEASPEALARFEALVRADEREMCAKVCEDDYGHVHHIALSCATAIRKPQEG